MFRANFKVATKTSCSKINNFIKFDTEEIFTILINQVKDAFFRLTVPLALGVIVQMQTSFKKKK